MASDMNSLTILSSLKPINGRPQSLLAVDWWQRVYSLPAANHFGLFDDAADPRGRRGSVEKAAQGLLDNGAMGLVGGFGDLAAKPQPDGTIRIERSIVLPNQGNSTVFLPILNASFDNLTNDATGGKLTGEELRSQIRQFFAPTSQGGQVSGLFAAVDGQNLEDALQYRQRNIKIFDYTTPYPVKDSLLKTAGYTEETYLANANAPLVQLKDLAKDGKLTIGPAVSDGYWLAADVKGGAHDLRFGGALGEPTAPFFSLDVNYHLLNPVYGTPQSDVLKGSDARDYLDGGDSDDRLCGGQGDDLLIGGNGKDQIAGGRGSDELWGDAGDDVFLFRRGSGADTIFDFSAGDQVVLKTPLVVSDPMVSQVELASGIGTQIDFGQGDILTFAGVPSSDLVLQQGLITHV